MRPYPKDAWVIHGVEHGVERLLQESLVPIDGHIVLLAAPANRAHNRDLVC
jgi:hypothetical protein